MLVLSESELIKPDAGGSTRWSRSPATLRMPFSGPPGARILPATRLLRAGVPGPLNLGGIHSHAGAREVLPYLFLTRGGGIVHRRSGPGRTCDLRPGSAARARAARPRKWLDRARFSPGAEPPERGTP